MKKNSGPIFYFALFLGPIWLIAGISDVIDAYRGPQPLARFSAQDIIDGKHGNHRELELTDFRFCSQFVRSWDRGGRLKEGWIHTIGITAGKPTDEPLPNKLPHLFFQPINSWNAEYFFDHFGKMESIRGKLYKGDSMSAMEKSMLTQTYPGLNLSTCLIFHEEPPAHSVSEGWKGIVIGSIAIVLAILFRPRKTIPEEKSQKSNRVM